ncbi:hypothetical protein ABZ509_07290, partial [Streptomyces lavendulocolor]
MTPDAHRLPGTAAQHGPDGTEADSAPDLLLAEPDRDLAEKATARFSRAGVRTVVCHDGAEALLHVGVRHPRTVLLAAPLPVIGAARVTELIARLHPVPVIVGAGAVGAPPATAPVRTPQEIITPNHKNHYVA